MIYTIVRKDKNNNIDAVISFSSISSMEETWSSTVTSQTVEYGYNVTDNINIEAPTYSISATLSSYSLFDASKEIVWDGEGFTTDNSSDDERSHVKARDEIIKIFSDRRLVTLLESDVNSNNKNLVEKETELKSGKFKENDSCIITSLSISHPSDGSGAFFVNMTLQKIVTAKIILAELEDGEKVALIKPLNTVFEPVKNTTEEKNGLTDPATGEPIEETISKEAGNYEAVNKRERALLGVDALKDYNKAVARAAYMTKVTGKTHTVDKKGDNYIVVRGWSKFSQGL